MSKLTFSELQTYVLERTGNKLPSDAFIEATTVSGIPADFIRFAVSEPTQEDKEREPSISFLVSFVDVRDDDSESKKPEIITDPMVINKIIDELGIDLKNTSGCECALCNPSGVGTPPHMYLGEDAVEDTPTVRFPDTGSLIELVASTLATKDAQIINLESTILDLQEELECELDKVSGLYTEETVDNFILRARIQGAAEAYAHLCYGDKIENLHESKRDFVLNKSVELIRKLDASRGEATTASTLAKIT